MELLKVGARRNRCAFSIDTEADLWVTGCAEYFGYGDVGGN